MDYFTLNVKTYSAKNIHETMLSRFEFLVFNIFFYDGKFYVMFWQIILAFLDR